MVEVGQGQFQFFEVWNISYCEIHSPLLYAGDSNGRLDKALDLVYDRVFTLSEYARQNVPKILVVLSASQCPQCSSSSLSRSATALKRLGVKIITIPINVARASKHLSVISSLPVDEFFMV